MRRMFFILSFVLCLGFISQCDWNNDDDDDDTCADHCWLEIIGVDLGEIAPNVDSFATVTFLLHCSGDYQSACDGFITHYRVSYFRTDGSDNVPGTFDAYLDTYLDTGFPHIPCGEEVSFVIKIFHADQYNDFVGVFKGYAVLQFWGNYNDDSDLYSETQISVQFANWSDDW